MRIPKVKNYHSVADSAIIHIEENNFSKPTYLFFNDKARIKFITRVERIVRSSLEYKELIKFLHEVLGMTNCMFFNNVSKKKGKHVRIEIHHIPFSLFDIVNIVLRKYEEEELEIDPYKIAEEVVKLHYDGKVGLVPLSQTIHELFHRGDIFIPLQYVDKGYLQFYREYHKYMTEYTEMLERLITLSKDFDLSKNNIIKKKLITIENEGYNSTPSKL